MVDDQTRPTSSASVVVEPDRGETPALVRVSIDGTIVGLEGGWASLCPGLRFGASANDLEPAGLRQGVLEAARAGAPTRFRVQAAGSEWLCRARPDGEGLAFEATSLPAPAHSGEFERIARFIAAAPLHVGVVDARERGRFLAWSPYSVRLFGYTAQEALGGLTSRDLYAHEAEYLSMLSAVEDGVHNADCTMVRKDGTTFLARAVVTGLRGEDGSIVERCSFLQDVSKEKRAERERNESLRVAGHDDRVRLMGQIAGGIAHDFNNLLTAIMSSAELLSLECKDLPQASEDLAVIQSAARSASSLTRRLLTFTRNKVEAPRRLDVVVWFQELLPFLQRLVPERIRFEHSMEGGGAIEIDPNELEQVVLNLVVNAVGAMSAGGSLTLRCSCVDGRMLLEVEDTGVGMPVELLERVFEPFFTTRAEGTGLGLATARAIVRRVGGEIWVLSAADRGSCFSVSIPLCAAQMPEPLADAAEPSSGSDRGRALLVEDQEDVRYAVARLLISMGFDVRAEADVEGGKRALEELEDCTLLLTDYMLPDGTGLDLLDDARAIFPSARAVLMSGYLQELEEADARFDRLLAKPFTRSQLWDALAELGVDPVARPAVAATGGGRRR